MFRLYMDMKITNQNTNVNFTSTPLHKVNIVSAKDGKLIPAIFSELKPYGRNNDRTTIKEIAKTWKSVPFLLTNIFSTNFCSKMDLGNNFYAVETLGEEPLAKRIVGLMQTLTEKDTPPLNLDKFDLELLIVKPDFAHTTKDRQFKNIGELLFGEAFNQAKKSNSDYIKFYSTEDDFYSKILKKATIDSSNNEHRFTIDKPNFDKYIDYWKTKFKIDLNA